MYSNTNLLKVHLYRQSNSTMQIKNPHFLTIKSTVGLKVDNLCNWPNKQVVFEPLKWLKYCTENYHILAPVLGGEYQSKYFVGFLKISPFFVEFNPTMEYQPCIPETRFSEPRFSEILDLVNKLQLPFSYSTLYPDSVQSILNLVNKRGLATNID